MTGAYAVCAQRNRLGAHLSPTPSAFSSLLRPLSAVAFAASAVLSRRVLPGPSAPPLLPRGPCGCSWSTLIIRAAAGLALVLLLMQVAITSTHTTNANHMHNTPTGMNPTTQDATSQRDNHSPQQLTTDGRTHPTQQSSSAQETLQTPPAGPQRQLAAQQQQDDEDESFVAPVSVSVSPVPPLSPPSPPPVVDLRSVSTSLRALDVFLVSVSLPPSGKVFGSKAHARVAVAATKRLGRVVQDIRAGSSLPVRLHLLVDHASLQCQREQMRKAYAEAQEASRQQPAPNERAALEQAVERTRGALTRTGISWNNEETADGSGGSIDVDARVPPPSPPAPSVSELPPLDRELVRAATQPLHPKFCLALEQYTRDVFECAGTGDAQMDAGQVGSCAPLEVYYHDYHALYASHALLRSLCLEFGATVHTPACLYLARTVLVDYLPSFVEEVVVLDSDMRVGGDLVDLHREVQLAEPRFAQAREDIAKQQEQQRQTKHKANSSSIGPNQQGAAAPSTRVSPSVTPPYALHLPVLGLSAEQQLAHAVIAAFDPLSASAGVLPSHRPFSVLSVPRGFNGGLQLQHVALMRSVSGDEARPSMGSCYRASLSRFQLSLRYAMDLGDQTLYSTLNLTHPWLFHELRPGWNRQLCTLHWPHMLEFTAGQVHALTMHTRQQRRTETGTGDEKVEWPLTPITERECWEAFSPPDVRPNPGMRQMQPNASFAAAATAAAAATSGVRILHGNCASDRRLGDDGVGPHHRAMMDGDGFDEDESARASRTADMARLAIAADAPANADSSCHWSREMDGARDEWIRTLHRCMPVRMREARRIDERRRARQN